MLESYCQILLLIKQIGQVHPLAPAQMAELWEETKRLGLGGDPGGPALEQSFFKNLA